MTSSRRDARRCGAAACVTKKLPFAVAPNAASQSVSSSSSSGFGANPSPAAFTSRSRPPSSLDRLGDEAARLLDLGHVAVGPAGREDRPAVAVRSRPAIAEPSWPVPPVTNARMNES